MEITVLIMACTLAVAFAFIIITFFSDLLSEYAHERKMDKIKRNKERLESSTRSDNFDHYFIALKDDGSYMVRFFNGYYGVNANYFVDKEDAEFWCERLNNSQDKSAVLKEIANRDKRLIKLIKEMENRI